MSTDDDKLSMASGDLGQDNGGPPAPLPGTRGGGSVLGGGVLGDLLQAILGGGGESPAKPADDRAPTGDERDSGSGPGGILAAVLGRLTAEQNLSPEAARAIVTFVVEKLFASRLRRTVGGATGIGGQEQAQPRADELELDGLLEKAGTDEGVSPDDVRATTLPQELATRSGLDLETVIKGLEMVMNVLAGKGIRPAARPSTKKKPKKSTAKKTTAKKSTAKKTTAKKSTAKKSPAKKTTAKKSAAKKTTAKKSTAKKTTAKKSTAKKTTAKKSTAKKTTAKKSTAKAKSADKPSSAEFQTKI